MLERINFSFYFYEKSFSQISPFIHCLVRCLTVPRIHRAFLVPFNELEIESYNCSPFVISLACVWKTLWKVKITKAKQRAHRQRPSFHPRQSPVRQQFYARLILAVVSPRVLESCCLLLFPELLSHAYFPAKNFKHLAPNCLSIKISEAHGRRRSFPFVPGVSIRSLGVEVGV